MAVDVKMPVKSTVSLPPRIALTLTQIANTPDPELALRHVLTDYLDLKLIVTVNEIQKFEQKWGMNFEQFSQARVDGTLPADPYSYPVESDFWEWEEAVTLFEHYEGLRKRWI